jgi:hypothetical protein
VQLAGEHEKGFAVDDELGGCTAGFKMRGGVGLGSARLGEKRNVYKNGEERGGWQRKKSDSHDARESITEVLKVRGGWNVGGATGAGSVLGFGFNSVNALLGFAIFARVLLMGRT